MEKHSSKDFISANEFSAWQGLFRGFLKAAERGDIPPYLYEPFTFIDFSLVPNSRIVKLSATTEFVENPFPTRIVVNIQYRTQTITASGDVIWRKQLPFPRSTTYSTQSVVSKEVIYTLINKFGGILEQPAEFFHSGLKYKRR